MDCVELSACQTKAHRVDGVEIAEYLLVQLIRKAENSSHDGDVVWNAVENIRKVRGL